MPTKCYDAQPLVNLKNNCPRKRIENRGISCNSIWICGINTELGKFSSFIRFRDFLGNKSVSEYYVKSKYDIMRKLYELVFRTKFFY